MEIFRNFLIYNPGASDNGQNQMIMRIWLVEENQVLLYTREIERMMLN